MQYACFFPSRIKHIQDEEIDFTDRIYQDKLPMVARSTASRAIKANIKLTEIMVEPNINKNRQKINAIINMHMQRRLLDREQNPGEWLFQSLHWRSIFECLYSNYFPNVVSCQYELYLLNCSYIVSLISVLFTGVYVGKANCHINDKVEIEALNWG